MPDFRRPPEWEQPADRHTQLIDPVLTVRQLSRFEFTRKQLTRIDHALVFSTPRGEYNTYLPPLRPSRGQAAAKRYSAVYEVDMGVHPVQAEIRLPSDNDAFEFRVTAEMSWQVTDPAHFVESGHRDVPRLLLSELEQAARPVTRRFPISRSAEAEQEVLRALSARGPLGSTAGLRASWTVRLRGDQENIDHQLRLQAIDHASTEQIHTERRGMEYDSELDRRTRQQDSLQVGRALDYGRQQQELVLQQQRWQHDLAMAQGRQQLELQKIEAEKIDFYQWHLQQGGVHGWALHLAQHPEDSRLVMNSMREDQLRLIQSQMELVAQLLGGDGAESYELEGPKQLALRTMSDILNQRLPGVAQESAPPQPTVPAPAVQGASPSVPPSPAPQDQVPAEPPLPPQPPQPRVRDAVPNVSPAAPAPPVDTPGAFTGWRPPPGYGSASVPPEPPAHQPPASTQDTESAKSRHVNGPETEAG
ncbi:hypothetical protein ACIRQP_07510 [Streptomyces sp. NPDC102274]|uniref:hypothetical protein n=1 Tax=Streptomyces sp. NPDC102274 TaxID=3366151 RepID=UPI00382E95CC